jgi:hypothetical protein
VFATAPGRIGAQDLLVPAVLLYIFAAIVSLKREEWLSDKGAMAAAMLCCFGLYLVVPDVGLGGSMTKIRFCWIAIVLGGLIAASAVRRPLETPISIYIAVLLSCNLYATLETLQMTSRGIADYISATDKIPRGAVFIRVRFPTPHTNRRYGFSAAGRDPFFHLEAYSASRRGSIDLSDYEAANPIFPLQLEPRIDEGQASTLWSLEGPAEDVADNVEWLLHSLPIPVEYVVVVSEDIAGQTVPPGQSKLTAQLDSTMRVFATSPENFVKVYKRL